MSVNALPWAIGRILDAEGRQQVATGDFTTPFVVSLRPGRYVVELSHPDFSHRHPAGGRAGRQRRAGARDHARLRRHRHGAAAGPGGEQAIAPCGYTRPVSVASPESLTPDQQAWLRRSEALWQRAHRLAAEHPEHDVSDLYHALRHLELQPSERLRLGLSRKRATNRPKDRAALPILEATLLARDHQDG